MYQEVIILLLIIDIMIFSNSLIRNKIHGVIFDLDGTILDTETLSTKSIQLILSKYNKTIDWELKKTLLGLRGPEWSKILVEKLELQGQITPEDVVKQWEINLNSLSSEVVAMPGAKELINQLYNLNIPIAIATSSSNEMYNKKKAKYFELFNKISTVVCGDDLEVKQGKPAPDIYLVAARRLGLDPKNCLAFEDALSGVESACRAGMLCIAIPDSRLDKQIYHSYTSYIYDSLVQFNITEWI